MIWLRGLDPAMAALVRRSLLEGITFEEPFSLSLCCQEIVSVNGLVVNSQIAV